jgi:cytoskeleton protein RodZ
MELKDMDNDNKLENSNREEIRIGALLRSEREKKGISSRRLSEIIKIREQLIDALENEDWEKLPARVFIKGFIRSYTIAIGYDTRKALRLFDRCVPLKGGEDNPKPLMRRTKRGNGIYYTIALMLLIAAAIFLLQMYLKVDKPVDAPQSANETAAVTAPVAEEQPEASINAPVQDQVAPVTEMTVTATGPEIKPVAQSESVAATAPQADHMTGDIPPETPLSGADQAAPNTPSDVITPPENPTSSENPLVEETAATPATINTSDTQTVSGKTLTATVSERTWVKIIADDTAPKEYIFQPGATHTWTAERGFDVTVGNAAGIKFSFNGETIKNLGEIGEVKKLRFPDDFQTKWEE